MLPRRSQFGIASMSHFKSGKSETWHFPEAPLSHLKSFYPKVFKRILDLLMSGGALLILGPVFLLVAVLIKLTSPGPIFFTQLRLGYRGRVFKVYKFRTMTNKPRKAVREILKDDAEVTAIGGLLRRLKIDELPQLFNVFAGDMSVVGPRPALPDQLSSYTDVASKRLLVKPGLTGLAQVNGNIHISWPERWEYDRQYVERISFGLDMQIVLKTFAIVIFGEDKFVRTPYV